MGEYVTATTKNFKIKKENQPAAYLTLCELNRYNDLKSGGSFGAEPTPKPADSKSQAPDPDNWFAWLDWNYDEQCQNLNEILEALGFETFYHPETHDLLQLNYQGHNGDTFYFLDALAPFIEPDSEIKIINLYNLVPYRMTIINHQWKTQIGEVIYHDQ